MRVFEPSEADAGGPLEIRLFGPADVRFAGTPVKFAKRATALAMLAIVVLRRGSAISRTSLAFTLFPDSDEQSALAELRRCLYLANKALRPGPNGAWLITDAETVAWNADAEAFVDVLSFERLAASQETQDEAIALYGGDLLEEIYEDWVIAERERLRLMYLKILGDSIDRHRARREFAAAIAYAVRALGADPWREDTLRTLVALRYESGDTAGALAEYDRFVKRLRDELGVAPMPDTVAVRRSILQNEPIPGSLACPPLVGDEDAPRALPHFPFVGRARELAALRGTWDRVARGAAALVVLRGEAGVGKTRLTAELARLVQSEGGRVFVGTTAAPESMPYQSIVEALRSGLPVLLARPPEAARRSVLARLIPEIRDARFPDVARPEASAEREATRIYDALAHAIATLASPRPLLLILEDLHWAGPATLEAIGAIVRESTRVPVLIVATCREEETPIDHPLRALLRALRPHRNVDEVALDRLAPTEVEDLVAHVADLRELGSNLAAELYARSEGNALFLIEAIIGVLERDHALDAAVAANIDGVLGTRIDRLGDEARAVADVAAVIGPGCSVGLVRDVTNLSAASIARGFDELLDRRIFREAGARASYDYVFTHHVLAEAVYARIEPELRALRHARVARLLEKSGATREGVVPARQIARQHERAGDAAIAADWYLTAAREAARVYAHGDAIDLATRAFASAPSDDVRREALDVRERAHGLRGDRAGQLADIDLLDRLTCGDARREFDVLTRRILLARTLGDSDEEGRLIATLEALATSLDENARAQALVQRATRAGLRSRQPEGLQPARDALAIYERLGDVRGQLECLFLLVDFTTNTGDVDASRRYLAEMTSRAATTADRVIEARALAVAAVATLLRQRYRESFELSTRALELQVATNDREAEAASRGRLAVTAAWLADFTTSLREFDLTLAAYESIGHKRGLALTHTNRTVQLMRLGLFEEALDAIAQSNDFYKTVGEQRTIVANGVNASFVRLHRGEAAPARDLARHALDAAREIGMPVFEAGALASLGNAERALGNVDSAIAHVEAGIAIRRPLSEPRLFVDDLADLTLVYAAANRADAALDSAEELAAIGTISLEMAFWPHYVYWAMAQGFRAGGDADRARREADRARSELHAFAMRIADERTRAAFLAVPTNADIASSAEP